MVREGHSYSAVAENALELRLPGKGSDSASGNSSSHLGTNSSLSQASSQELHAVQSMDMDSPKGGWPSPDESGVCLSGDMDKEQLSAESLGGDDEETEGQEETSASEEVGSEWEGECCK
jgi:hypothetical protein